MGHSGRRHRDSFTFEAKRQSIAHTLQSAPLALAGAKRNFCVNTVEKAGMVARNLQDTAGDSDLRDRDEHPASGRRGLKTSTGHGDM